MLRIASEIESHSSLNLSVMCSRDNRQFQECLQGATLALKGIASSSI